MRSLPGDSSWAHHRWRIRDRGGWTLLETMLYVGLLAILSSPLVITILGLTRMTEEGNLLARITETNRSTMHRITDDVRRSLSSTVVIENAGKALGFSLPDVFDGSAPTPGNAIRYEFQDEPSDPNNGNDDNGNGVTDEKILVRMDQTVGESEVIGAFFDPNSSGFTAAGNAVVITLTTMGWTKGSQVQTKMTQTVRVQPRN